jgi:hypothetical protein
LVRIGQQQWTLHMYAHVKHFMLNICRGNKKLTNVFRSAYFVHKFYAKVNPTE